MHDSPVERITNAALGFLAVWTLLCHAVVFGGGNLHQLLILAALTAAAGSPPLVVAREESPEEPL